MASLYEINQEILDCVDKETGEIVNAEKFNDLVLEQETKRENIALWYKNLTSDVEAYKKEETYFKNKKDTAKRQADRLKEYLKNDLSGQAFKTTKVNITFTKSTSSKVTDIDKIPSQYLIPQSPKIDISALKADVKNNVKVDGFVLCENINIQIK